jgi:hypothetical protein
MVVWISARIEDLGVKAVKRRHKAGHIAGSEDDEGFLRRNQGRTLSGFEDSLHGLIQENLRKSARGIGMRFEYKPCAFRIRRDFL